MAESTEIGTDRTERPTADTVHGTTVAVGNVGVLLRGPSGSGKSDLALRLIDGGAELVADDRTVLRNNDGALMAFPPEPIRGKLEVRGLGIIDVPYRETARIGLAVDLTPLDQIERMPEQRFFVHDGVEVPVIQLCAFEASVQAKLRLALSNLRDLGKPAE